MNETLWSSRYAFLPFLAGRCTSLALARLFTGQRLQSSFASCRIECGVLLSGMQHGAPGGADDYRAVGCS